MYLETNTRINRSKTLLTSWLASKVSADSLAWLNQQVEKMEDGVLANKILFTSFSAVPRYLGKEKLHLSIEKLQTANELIEGWIPINWTCEQAGRTLLLLSFPHGDREQYRTVVDRIVTSADVGEAIAFYQSLALLPYPEEFQMRAAEGIRTNMTSVFNAVALDNPYPANYLDDLAWNQMVLKALFVGSPLHRIYGLERRNNQKLSQMLVDYASERLAANRSVNSELWKLAMPFQAEAVAKLKSTSAVISSHTV